MGFKDFDPKTAKTTSISLFPAETTDLSGPEPQGWLFDKLRQCYADPRVRHKAFASFLNGVATSGMVIFAISRTKNGVSQLLINDSNCPWAKTRKPDEYGSILSGQEYLAIIALLEGVAEKIVEESKKDSKKKSASVWRITDPDILEFLEERFGKEALIKQEARFRETYEDSQGRKVLAEPAEKTDSEKEIPKNTKSEPEAKPQPRSEASPQAAKPTTPSPAPTEIIRTIPRKNNPSKEPNFGDRDLSCLCFELNKQIDASLTDITVVVECAVNFLNKAVAYGVIQNSRHFDKFLSDLGKPMGSFGKPSCPDLDKRKTAVLSALTARFEELLQTGVEISAPTRMYSDFHQTHDISITIAREVSNERWAKLGDANDTQFEQASSEWSEWQKKVDALKIDPEFKSLSTNLDESAKQELIRSLVGEEPSDRLDFLPFSISTK